MVQRADFCESPYFLVILVSAKHFDYANADRCLQSLVKNSRDGRFGHAWIYVRGIQDGRPVALEGGHSGEINRGEARYFDGVADAIDRGDSNPIRYLWTTRQDGFFQAGSGGHRPTYAAKIDLTPEQFEKIVAFIKAYSFRDYALTGQQCTTFAVEVAALADWKLEADVTLTIKPKIFFGGVWMPLWKDARYSRLKFGSPDKLEQSMIQSVLSGQAEEALNWYQFRLSSAARLFTLFERGAIHGHSHSVEAVVDVDDCSCDSRS